MDIGHVRFEANGAGKGILPYGGEALAEASERVVERLRVRLPGGGRYGPEVRVSCAQRPHGLPGLRVGVAFSPGVPYSSELLDEVLAGVNAGMGKEVFEKEALVSPSGLPSLRRPWRHFSFYPPLLRGAAKTAYYASVHLHGEPDEGQRAALEIVGDAVRLPERTAEGWTTRFDRLFGVVSVEEWVPVVAVEKAFPGRLQSEEGIAKFYRSVCDMAVLSGMARECPSADGVGLAAHLERLGTDYETVLDIAALERRGFPYAPRIGVVAVYPTGRRVNGQAYGISGLVDDAEALCYTRELGRFSD